MDHKFFNQLIEDINITIGLHIDSMENIHSKCICDDPECHGKCPHCLTKINIHNLSNAITSLNDYTINTSNLIQLIDAEAFRYALENHTDLKCVKCYPVFNDPNAELDYPNSEPDSFAIEATYERYAMNPMGYHIGYETVVFKWMAIKKSQLEILGLPKLLSNWVVMIDKYVIESKDLPDNEDPIHNADCEFDDVFASFDNCDCADSFEGYWQPDDDFFYQEMNHIIEMMQIPEASFNPDKREWWLGDISFNLDEFESIKEYHECCIEDNGMPFTG